MTNRGENAGPARGGACVGQVEVVEGVFAFETRSAQRCAAGGSATESVVGGGP